MQQDRRYGEVKCFTTESQSNISESGVAHPSRAARTLATHRKHVKNMGGFWPAPQGLFFLPFSYWSKTEVMDQESTIVPVVVSRRHPTVKVSHAGQNRGNGLCSAKGAEHRVLPPTVMQESKAHRASTHRASIHLARDLSEAWRPMYITDLPHSPSKPKTQ